MRNGFQILLLIAASCCTGCGTSPPAHVETLRDLERDTPLESIEYRHRPTTVVIPDEPGEQGVVRADCSGLLNEVLKHTETLDDAALSAWFGRPRPVARSYAEAIRDERGFTRIARLSDAAIGDIIAIMYEEDASNTGHVMVIDAKPGRLRSTGVDGAAYEWRCEVIDSSATGHGEGDSRFQNGKRIRAGLGRGFFRIFTDAHGVPVAHAFTVSANAKVRSVNDRPLYIGRIAR